MSNHELQSHKKSDSIKWVIVFTLIVILFAGMAVSLFKDFQSDKPAEETQIEFSDDGVTGKMQDGYDELNFKE